MQEAHEKEIQVKKILIEGKNTLHDSVMFHMVTDKTSYMDWNFQVKTLFRSIIWFNHLAWYRLVKIIMAKMILVIEESILKRIITDCDDV